MTTMTSRVEIADHVEEAFRHGPASREVLLAEAVRTGARPVVIEVLGRLPEGPYPTLRDLWPDLPGLPVERSHPPARDRAQHQEGDAVGVQYSDRRP